MKRKLKNNKGITLIALVVTIVVLLILAGVSISMLTGENGIITQAQQSKLQTEIGKEKEYITLSVSALKGDKMSRGDTSEITSSELQTEMNKYTDEATVTGSGTLTVTYESGRSYEVDQDGNIEQKEELTPEEAKKIVYATEYGAGLLVETADGTVYYVDDIQFGVMQKIEITDAEIITTSGIKEAEGNYIIDNQGNAYLDEYFLGGEYSGLPICVNKLEGNELNGKKITKMQIDYDVKIALDSEGKVYTWGDNEYGQLGNGTNEDSNKPACISDIQENALNGKNIIDIQMDGNNYAVIALDSEGKVYTWGWNGLGKLGTGTEEEYSNEPICISDIEGNALNNKKIVKIVNNSTIIALDSEGKVYTWGNNQYGQLGNGTDNWGSEKPICISDIQGNVLNSVRIEKISYNDSRDTIVAIDSEGKVYTWGENYFGQLGDGTKEDSNEPICISDIQGSILNEKNIIEICNDATMIALDSEGKIYIWGGDITSEPICMSDIPEIVLSGKNIVKMKKGDNELVAIDEEGDAYVFENMWNLICITDDVESELYNKKIKDINVTEDSMRLQAYITEEGELYIYALPVAG